MAKEILERLLKYMDEHCESALAFAAEARELAKEYGDPDNVYHDDAIGYETEACIYREVRDLIKLELSQLE